jgi:L-glyceraldehyde 3-phosphate reductase
MPASSLSPRPLGSSGIEVSALSLGSWRTYDRLDSQAGTAILREAWDQGIDFFDDARYDDETGRAPIATGYSEVLFGELFRAAGIPRAQAVVANKLWWEFWPAQSAEAELDASLRRMGFEYVDLIYASAPPPGLSIADLAGQMGELIASGRARAWGMLNWPADLSGQASDVAAALSLPEPCAAQLPYSLVQRRPVEDAAMTAALGARGASVVASFSLAGGILTAKYADGTRPGRAAAMLGQRRFAPAVAAAGELAGLAREFGTTAAALAMAFPLASPDVCSVLFGATSPGQVIENCGSVDLLARLSQADLAQLRRIGLPRRA